MSPPAAAGSGGKAFKSDDLLKGGLLSCAEAATVGLPFEVWKTHMGTYRTETTSQAFKNIYQKGGVGAFWRGFQPKMVESFLKGAILMFAKDAIIRSSLSFGASETMAGLVGGFGGGVAQVTVLGPCTFLVTAAVTGDKSIGVFQRISMTYKSQGIAGFYHGGTALMLRQGTNWASRQGFTDGIRVLMKKHLHGDDKAKLSIAEEATAGIIGGALSTWNQPFEVMRIEAQSNTTKGNAPVGIVQTAKNIVQSSGYGGLFAGIAPRIGLAIAQTLFMVTTPKILASYGLY